MTILKNIVDKKNKGDIKVETHKYYESKIVGEKIEFKKIPLSAFLQLTSEYDLDNMKTSDMVPMLNDMIFNFATMFRDPEGVEMALNTYTEASTPKELPEFIFEGNMDEMTDMFELIQSFYEGEVEKARDDIKN